MIQWSVYSNKHLWYINTYIVYTCKHQLLKSVWGKLVITIKNDQEKDKNDEYGIDH